jgi:hypothetical protein
MPKCFFCKSTVYNRPRSSCYFCFNCPGGHVSHVITVFMDDEPDLVHIYVDNSKIYNRENISMDFEERFQNSDRMIYHARMHIKENYTVVCDPTGEIFKGRIATFDGLPLTPQNIEHRLKTILVFS